MHYNGAQMLLVDWFPKIVWNLLTLLLVFLFSCTSPEKPNYDDPTRNTLAERVDIANQNINSHTKPGFIEVNSHDDELKDPRQEVLEAIMTGPDHKTSVINLKLTCEDKRSIVPIPLVRKSVKYMIDGGTSTTAETDHKGILRVQTSQRGSISGKYLIVRYGEFQKRIRLGFDNDFEHSVGGCQASEK